MGSHVMCLVKLTLVAKQSMGWRGQARKTKLSSEGSGEGERGLFIGLRT